MIDNNLKLANFLDFENDVLGNAMDWAIEAIFQNIWLSDIWSKPAKGGKHSENPRFEKYRDMSYQVHIFSGVAMTMRVIDYSYPLIKGNMSDEELEAKLKRSIFGYLYHDFNKICGSDYRMEEKTILDDFIKSTFNELASELKIDRDNVYQIVVCTEKGTSANILSNEVDVTPLNFEMNFSRMSDVLSSTFNSIRMDTMPDIKFGEKILIPGSAIRSIKFSNTNLLAISSLIKKSVVLIISEILQGKYLWSDQNTIYYVKGSKDIVDIDFEEEVRKEFSKKVSTIMKPENLLNLNDRRVDNSAAGFLDQTEDSILNFTKNNENLKKCIHLGDIKLNTVEKRNAAEKFTDFISSFKSSVFSFNYRFTRNREKEYSLRDGLEIKEYDESQKEERLRIFLLRYVQLKKDLNSSSAKEIRNRIEEIVKTKYDELTSLIGKDAIKTVLIFPMLLNDSSIKWAQLLDDIIRDLNKKKKSVDYDHVISRVVPIFGFNTPLPNVPTKYSMSMVNGYPAREEGKGERLYGLRTNGFNNRLPTSKIGFGRIDKDSMFEYNIRRNLIPDKSGQETLIYLRFPGAIPYLDLSNLLRKFMGLKSNEIIEVSKLSLSLEEFSQNNIRGIRNDDSFFLTGIDIKTESDILKQLLNVLDIANKTKMLVKVSYSNAPIFEDQLEAITFDISSSILSSFSWNKIRLNEIEGVKRVIEAFSVLANGSLVKINFDDTTEIMLAYKLDPMSIFYFAHKRIFDNSKDKKTRGFGRQFSQRIEDIRKLGYEVEKRGDKKMKNIEELAKIASRMVYARWEMSGNDRTWMIRDPLEAIESTRAKIKDGEKRDIGEFWDVIGGTLNTKLRRDRSDGKSNWVPVDEIKKFSDALIKLLKEDYNGKIPTGTTKSYLINAFEFEYMLTKEKVGEKDE